MPFILFSQNKYEKEERIEKSAFPENAMTLLELYSQDAKRIRFYRETDSTKVSFESKFKKDKIHYSVEFDEKGNLEDVEFIIKTNDIPEESWTKINTWFKDQFDKVKVKKIQQQYPVQNNLPDKTLKDAFQNLILPYIRYEVIFSTKEENGYQTYEGLFDGSGNLLNLRESIKSGYDHILY